MLFCTPKQGQVVFSADHCDTLFEAVLANDTVDENTYWPEDISLEFSAQQLKDNFLLCRQLWETDVCWETLRHIARKLARNEDLNEKDRVRFKHMRATFKQFRFAYMLYDKRHKYPMILHIVTKAMGCLQDALNTKDAAGIRRESKKLCFFSSRIAQLLVTLESRRFSSVSGKEFRDYVENQMSELKEFLSQEQITGHQFHAARKIISRQVSFYDALRALRPSSDAILMSRSLAAINGLMGEEHDKLIHHRTYGTQDYYDEGFTLPGVIRERLNDLLSHYQRKTA